jgi:hypothetical protein
MLKLRAVALVAGIIVVLGGLGNGWDNYASRSWPAVPGKMERSGVTPTQRNYLVELSYVYSVQDHAYRGHYYRRGGNLVSWESTARDIVGQFPPGAEVKVYYDPADPRHSALRTGLEWGDSIMPLLGAAGLVYALWPRKKASAS